MTELKAYRFRVDPLHQEDTAASMTSRGMKGGVWQTRTFEQGLERAGEQMRGVDGFARPIREHQCVTFDREPFGVPTPFVA